MLLWLRDYLADDVANTTLVLISDGAPAGPVDCSPVDHTRAIAREMFNTGLRYISVLIETNYTDLYPVEVSCPLSGEEDYDNLAEAFARLDGMGF